MTHCRGTRHSNTAGYQAIVAQTAVALSGGPPAWLCAVPGRAFVRRRFIALALLEPDRITAADRAAPHHSRVNTDVDLIMLGRRA
jgi:hypothetical protein